MADRFKQKHTYYLGSIPDEGRIIEEKLEYNPTQKQMAYYNRLKKKCEKFDCEKPKQPQTRSEYSNAIDFYVGLLKEKPSDEEIGEILNLFNLMSYAQRVRFIAYGEGLLEGANSKKKTVKPRAQKKS